MKEKEPALLVWVEGLRGPSPQIWYGDHTDTVTGKLQPHLVKLEIPDADRHLTLKELVAKYPYPHKEDESGTLS